MSPATGSPVSTPPEDEFLARLRRSAESAVPPSTLDLDDVLRSSRRGARRHRALTVTASVLALAVVGTGVATAGGPAGLRDLAREVVAGDPGYDVLVAEPMTAEVAPGVVAVIEPATYLRDDGTYVLDLGLGAWRDDERFLVEYRPAAEVGEMPELRVVAGDDDDLAALRRGETAGAVVQDDYLPTMIVEQTGGAEILFLGIESSIARPGADPASDRSRRETWMLLAGDSPGATGKTVALPEAGVGGLLLRAAVLGRDGVPVAGVRGVLDSTTSWNGNTTGLQTCGTLLPEAARVDAPGCRSTYDPTTRAVAQVEPPAAALDRSVLDLLLPLAPDPGAPFDDAELRRACLAARDAEPTFLPDVTQLDPEGVDGDAWRQCVLDTTLVLSAWMNAEHPEGES